MKKNILLIGIMYFISTLILYSQFSTTNLKCEYLTNPVGIDAIQSARAYIGALQGLKVTKTTVEYQVNPILISTGTPLFGWQIQSDKTDIVQGAYAVELYSKEKGWLKKYGTQER